MRLVSFRAEGGIRLGSVQNDGIVDVAKVGGPSSMRALIEGGPRAMSSLERTIAVASPHLSLEGADLAPPVLNPPNIVCVGRNYPAHVAEENADPPSVPLLFSKHTSSLRGPEADIRWSREHVQQVDFEAELAVVIGIPTSEVTVQDALGSVFGYMCANDISARDIQFTDGQWYRGKSVETFFPTGPTLVTPSEVIDPQDIELRCTVNGVTMQSGNTSEMFFSVAEIISYCSRTFTLLPGDIISTGTPGGVGVFRDPPVFLKDGDTVEVEVSQLGRLRNVCRVDHREKGA